MDDETKAAVYSLQERLADAELSARILGYALRGLMEHVNPTAKTATLRMANTAVFANCPDGERPRRERIIRAMFPEARDGGAQGEFIPPPRE